VALNNDDEMPGTPDLPRVCYEIRDWVAILVLKQEACTYDCCPVAACVQSINRGESIKRCEIGTNGSSVLSERLWKSVHPRSFTDSCCLAARHKHMPGLRWDLSALRPGGGAKGQREGAVVQMESCSYPFLVIGPRLATRW
jgi:hypothetical protein